MSEAFAFGVIGINHNHIYGQVDAMIGAGCTFKAFYAPEDDLAAQFAEVYPDAKRVTDEAEILNDPEVLLVVGAGIPNERAGMAVRAMKAGKDVMVDKPGCTTFDQLAEVRKVQAETGRIYSILYSEHYRQRSTVKAIELIRAGAIGRVVSTVGLGPHRLGNNPRPDWFWDPDRNGSPLTDIASHQFEQFLSITGASEAKIMHSVQGNYDNPETPDFIDYGHAVVSTGDGVTGYIRVDWFTPDGAPAWGDGRLFVIGTEGTIELRKYMDVEGRDGANHLFLTDGEGTRYIDCSEVPLPFGPALRDDVLNRTETAMGQEHCFLAMQLALEATAQAVPVAGDKRPEA